MKAKPQWDIILLPLLCSDGHCEKDKRSKACGAHLNPSTWKAEAGELGVHPREGHPWLYSA